MPMPTYGALLNLTLEALKQLGGSAPVGRFERQIVQSLDLAAAEAVVLKPRLARARRDLRADGLLDNPARGQWTLTEAGRQTESVDATAVRQPEASQPEMLVLRPSVISEALDRAHRKRLKLPPDDDTPMPVIVELNLRHAQGLEGAEARFHQMYADEFAGAQTRAPLSIANTYYRCDLTMNQVRALVRRDQSGDGAVPRGRAIFRVWPDFPITRLTDRSVSTVKGDAALRSYNASGLDIVWAVIDSGIDGAHPHFRTYDTLGGDVALLHRDFTRPDAAVEEQAQSALTDTFGHGTHVAGIVAGGLPAKPPGQDGKNLDTFKVGQRGASSDPSTAAEEMSSLEVVEERAVADQGRLTGVAPQCRLVSLKVLDNNGESRSSDVIRALQYVRENANGNGRILRIHGVNLSLGYEFNAKWFACGQSPICVEVDKLVRSGVVVVVAAGNTGYGQLNSSEGQTDVGMSLTINDPGNAELAITVGATHRDSPYTYGVSYFSSKGPTGDGRAKPNLVAPGERITSCAAGKRLATLKPLYGGDPPPGAAAYIDDSGTSMAAPHVSGAVAAFLSIRREFIGQPERVKQLFLENATSLGRDRYFEGHGLVDLMRTIQAV